jgi:hypothetical protein
VRDGVGASGEEGEPRRVIEVEGAEATEVPAAFVAVTVKVYGTPRLKPVTRNGDDVPLTVAPLEAVTVYPVKADPPLEVGAVKLISAAVVITAAIPVKSFKSLISAFESARFTIMISSRVP